MFPPGHSDPGERDSEEDPARQCQVRIDTLVRRRSWLYGRLQVAVLRVPVLLLHPRLLHVAGHLSQQAGGCRLLTLGPDTWP